MKSIGIIKASALFLILGISVPAIARQGQQEKPKEQEQPAKPEHQQEARAPKQQEAKPERQQETKLPKQAQSAGPAAEHQQAKAQQDQQQKQQQQKQQQQANSEKAQQQHNQQQAKGQQEQQQHQKQQQQANSNQEQQQQHQQNQQQANYSHPPQRTQQAMARQHAQPALHLSSRGNGRIPDERFHSNFGRGHEFHIGNPVMVGGYSRFQYGGYWFGFVQPWPVGWYYTDDVYIDYVDDGYYMYNPYYPGSRFAISVVL
jgi:hypothetical protein